MCVFIYTQYTHIYHVNKHMFGYDSPNLLKIIILPLYWRSTLFVNVFLSSGV